MAMDKQMGQLGREVLPGNMDALTRDALAARAAGMSYGKYKSLQPPASAPAKEEKKTEKQGKYNKTCALCGAEFIAVRVNQKYCGDYCRNQVKNAAYRAKYRKQVIQEATANG